VIRFAPAAIGAFALLVGGRAFAENTPAGEPTAQAKPPHQLQTLRDIAPAVSKCWSPPYISGVGQVTVMLSFRRDGTIIGTPRVTYSSAAEPDEKQMLAESLLGALKKCGPLPLSDSLGAAIAGRMFAIKILVVQKKGAHDI
jgi:hypothetical protein